MANRVSWKAGLVLAAVLCAGAVGGGAWSFWSARHHTSYEIETHDPVSGLIVTAPVEFHGVEVGNVTRIELVDPDTVKIRLSVTKDAPVSRRTVATIRSRGLAARGFTGYVYVDLEDTGSGTGALPVAPGRPYPMIATAPSQPDTIDTTAAALLQKVEALTRLLQSVLDQGTVASLKGAVDGLREVTAMLAANNGRLGSLIVNAERDSREMRPLLEASNLTLRELRTALLPQLYRAVSDLDGLARAMEPTVSRLSRDPAALLRGTALPPGPGER